MSDSKVTSEGVLPLTTEAAEHTRVYVSAFNSGDPGQIDRLYEPDGILVLDPANPLTGTARREAYVGLLGLGVPISATVRHAHVVDDTALLVTDWVISGPGPGGQEVDMRGTAADVARRGADGLWRYTVNNPFGTAGSATPE